MCPVLICLVLSVELVDRKTITTTSYLQYIEESDPLQFAVDNVIDGNRNSAASSCFCCGAVTEGGWIQLDLQSPYLINHIVITGRSDRKYIFASSDGSIQHIS